MLHGHGVVDLRAETCLAGGCGKVDKIEWNPAAGDFNNSAVIGRGYKEDFPVVSCSFDNLSSNNGV